MKRHCYVALGVCLLSLVAQAQEVQRITITGASAPQAPTVAGFGDISLARAPFSATVIDQRALQDAGISSLADITRLDAGITDAYNAPGYWNQLAVRGYTLDNRFNYRRDGLPINAETAIGQANKQRLEVLKGTSGLQAGTSAPGGLLNLVVKRPRERVRDASLAWAEDGTLEAALDIGGRGSHGLGWRINLDGARLDPTTRDSRGRRWLAAAAVDARLGGQTLVEAEFEASRQSQPSTPGFSLLGARLPDASDIDPRLNLNNQSWSLPVVFEGRTGSLRVTHTLADDAHRQVDLVAHALRQRLTSQDRIAFPFGCGAEGAFDRYCSDGSFDYYDFRSENEQRTSDAFDLALRGRARLAGHTHHFNAGVLFTRYVARFQRQAFNGVGTGTIDGASTVPADPTLTDENTNRDERSTEWHLQDRLALGERWSLWAGLRHTRLERGSVRTDGSRATRYVQSFTTPWLALSHALSAQTQVYASAGEGIESDVVPNRARWVNAGQALPALKSRQVEIGLKHAGDAFDVRIAAFDIRRPATNDFHTATGAPAFDDCADADPCVRRSDGIARHRGVEVEAEWKRGALSLRGSAMLLRARRSGSSDSSINGLEPTNVPDRSAKLQAAYNVAALPGLAVVAFVTHEGRRMVLPDNSVATPGWTRVDLGARWTQRLGPQTLTWRLGLDNVFDRRAWQEAPFQFGHAYLYPLAPRPAHASLAVAF
ncbi:MAG TPA: TonB-dependent receptor [Burkholderiaceae bacterium]|nr:TonB-dependent receptor [Burkholderiaceae bacterium]